MALTIYNLSLWLYGLVIGAAALFNTKAAQFRDGRKGLPKQWQAKMSGNKKPMAWFHAASLGEFEQGKPVIEAFRASYPDHLIFLTFFSPSGYELRKDTEVADLVTYLPLDSRAKACELLDTIKPSVIFFIKYEFWFHYLREARQRNIPLYCISALFTPKHIFFKPYGSLHREMLGFFDHIFVQNQQSLELIKGIDIHQVSVSGDTRFDRVVKTLAAPDPYPVVEAFKGTKTVMVIGSSWPSDMQYLNKVINEANSEVKFIIAPHEVEEQRITTLQKGIKRKTARFTVDTEETIAQADVLIIDTIGMLSSIYQYGRFAYIGGAFGDGLHNILEAVTFGLPVIFGNKGLDKFPESLELCRLGGAFTIDSQAELDTIFARLSTDKDFLSSASTACQRFIQDNTGATDEIITYLKNNYEG
jgi:3-deoxy-D-manno-octulosonic-acid transferase